jgi:hypothetical protein
LIALVHGAEREGIKMEIPVTLSVGGFIVSGLVISGGEYFEEFSEIVRYGLTENFDEESKQNIATTFRNLGNVYEPREETLEGVIERESYNFVHLRDTRFLHPGGDPVPTNTGMLWRTKLEAVDGFTLGMMVAAPDEEPEIDEELELDE